MPAEADPGVNRRNPPAPGAAPGHRTEPLAPAEDVRAPDLEGMLWADTPFLAAFLSDPNR